MAKVTGGQAVVASLRAEGVKAAFGVPGLHNLYLYDALVGQHEIRHILTRHEQGAAFMADGYARTTGEVGVCLTTSGPGATNTLTALAAAYVDSSPVLLLAGQVPSPYIGQERGVLHEMVDQLGCFRSVTAWSATLRRPEEIPAAIHHAFQVMKSGRPRPVVLELPMDVLESEAAVEEPALAAAAARPAPAAEDVVAAVRLLLAAERPLLYAGGGVVGAGAAKELVRLAELLGAPVATSPNGRGAIPDDHPLALGCLQPTQGPVPRLLKAADVVLAVGARLGHTNTAAWQLWLPPNLIQVDVDPAQIGRNYPARLGVVGDARVALRQMGDLVEQRLASPRQAWTDGPTAREELRATVANRSRELAMMDGLRRVLARDAIICNDASLINGWSTWFLPVYEPRTFISPWGSAAMGFGFPAAIGARVAHPDRQVVALAGDGGFLFTAQELATCVKYNLDLVVVVYNDHCFGAIKMYQQMLFGRVGESDLANPDFVALARSFGAQGLRANAPEELPAAVAEAIRLGGPVLVELAAPLRQPWR